MPCSVVSAGSGEEPRQVCDSTLFLSLTSTSIAWQTCRDSAVERWPLTPVTKHPMGQTWTGKGLLWLVAPQGYGPSWESKTSCWVQQWGLWAWLLYTAVSREWKIQHWPLGTVCRGVTSDNPVPLPKDSAKTVPEAGVWVLRTWGGGFRGSQSEWLRSEVVKLVRFPKFLGTYGLPPHTHWCYYNSK